MRVYQKLIISLLKLTALGVAIGYPTWSIYKDVVNSVENVSKITYNLSMAGVLIILALIYLFYLKKIITRKLEASVVVEELGKSANSGILFIRVLRTLEYVLPFAIVYFTLKGLSLITINPRAPYEIFRDLSINILIGSFILYISDLLRSMFNSKNEIINSIKLDEAKKAVSIKIKK